MNVFIQLSFTGLQPEQMDILIAKLAEAGYDGFIQEDSFGEENGGELKAYINKRRYDKSVLHDITFKYQLSYTEQTIEEKNWNAEWEAGFEPVVIDDFVAIRAGFHEPVGGVEQEIIITPKMSFGTGHHATTALMVRQMRRLDFTGKHVFDFGTGTGILAILAAKSGAAFVDAIDNDEWSIANAKENIANNHCGDAVALEKAESFPGNRKYDIILANINRNVITDNLGNMHSSLKLNGVLLLSGLLEEDEKEITRLCTRINLQVVDLSTKKGWICLKING